MSATEKYTSDSADKLKNDPEYAINYIYSSMKNHNESLEHALGDVIEIVSCKYVAEKTGSKLSDVQNILHHLKRNSAPISAIIKILRVFGIDLEISVKKRSKS